MIQVLASIEQTLHKTIYGINVQFPDGENAAVKIMRNAVSFHGPVMAAVGLAVSVAESALASVNATPRGGDT